MEQKMTNQRVDMINFLFSQIDFKLIDYSNAFNKEVIDYSCNKCNLISKKIPFPYLLSKIKHNQACTCCKNIDIDIDMYSYELYHNTLKEVEEEQKRVKFERKLFLNNEKKMISYSVCKNRKALSYKTEDFDNYIVKCKYSHIFEISYKDLLQGKFCDLCEDNNNKYHEESY